MGKIKTSLSFIIFIVLFVLISFSAKYAEVVSSDIKQDTIVKYSDGIYEGRSRASYTDEPYFGFVRLVIKNGTISHVRFMIRDSALHETFDAKYEKHFAGNPVYIEQSRNDWKGVQAYPEILAKTKDIEKVDAASGATWSYDIFKASVREALKKGK